MISQAVSKVKLIQERLLAVKIRQKSYADNQRRDLEFQIGDWVFLKVSPMKGVMRFGRKGKLSPRYIRPYQIVDMIGKVTYELDVPSELEVVIEELSYEEKPLAILDRQVKKVTYLGCGFRQSVVAK
ncbi:uncharacterized protein [Solanum lycopersicum]|uniref:uncharacterized protein n=1 Tax=Solanum lycopersicum TaxID=4081 RepID=UPI003749F178